MERIGCIIKWILWVVRLVCFFNSFLSIPDTKWWWLRPYKFRLTPPQITRNCSCSLLCLCVVYCRRSVTIGFITVVPFGAYVKVCLHLLNTLIPKSIHYFGFRWYAGAFVAILYKRLKRVLFYRRTPFLSEWKYECRLISFCSCTHNFVIKYNTCQN